ncbi:MAG: glycosyltransferase [Anaerolineaceae bacterium]|nr:glycosyltransferase [Anaerolineaceae bacterium]
MRILIIADGRSPITRGWLEGLLARGIQASLLSSFPCPPPLPGLEHFAVLPLAFSQYASSRSATTPGKSAPPGVMKKLVRRFRAWFLAGRYQLGPLSVQASAERFRRLVSAQQPELVHAMRIPFEGMLGSFTPPGIPLVVSIWGNDLTLHAGGSLGMGTLTRRALQCAGGLIADARRDIRLAQEWGYAAEKPWLVAPGAGGLSLEQIRAVACQPVDALLGCTLGDTQALLVNPRGIRPGSVRTDTFFQALPPLLARFPGALVACPSMAGQPEALRWMRRLNLDENRVKLLPTLSQPELWSLFHRSQVFVSISQHDGTPNSFLEGIACGSFPVVGDIESLREWITPGVNGLLVPPDEPLALVEAIASSLAAPALRANAAAHNARLMEQRANAPQVMRSVEAFYRALLR